MDDLHPALQPVASLIGTWEGTGFGKYPTIQDFTYREELTFTDVGKPFLFYNQRTWSPGGGLMHVETGYLRVPTSTTAEFVIAQPTGQSELAEGSLRAEAGVVEIEVQGRILNTVTAKKVDATMRRYRLDGDALTTSFHMAAVGVTMTRHLDSELQRKF